MYCQIFHALGIFIELTIFARLPDRSVVILRRARRTKRPPRPNESESDYENGSPENCSFLQKFKMRPDPYKNGNFHFFRTNKFSQTVVL